MLAALVALDAPAAAGDVMLGYLPFILSKK
jgi:hypothetical protein